MWRWQAFAWEARLNFVSILGEDEERGKEKTTEKGNNVRWHLQ